MRLAAALASIVVTAGCTLIPGGAANLDGTWWLTHGVHDGEPVPIVEPGSITMTIDGPDVGGRAACNIYGGAIEIHGSRVTISALSMTEMACEEILMASEAAYLAAVGVVETAARTGDNLVLTGPGVELRYVLEPQVADAGLIGTGWRLDSLISGDAVSSTMSDAATLELARDGTLSGFTGCRSFWGRDEIAGSEVEVSDLEVDDRACAAELQDQDDHILSVLGEPFTAAIEGGT